MIEKMNIVKDSFTTCEMPCEEKSEYFGIKPLPENPATTMAYVPFQTNTTMYPPELALKYGTAFLDLNKPFFGGRC